MNSPDAHMHQPRAHPLAARQARSQQPTRLHRCPCAAAWPAAAALRPPPLLPRLQLPGNRTNSCQLRHGPPCCSSSLASDSKMLTCSHPYGKRPPE